jgi:hypothetical protein
LSFSLFYKLFSAFRTSKGGTLNYRKMILRK